MLITITQFLLRNSEKFEKAKLFVQSSLEIKNKVGDVMGYGLMINSNEKSDLKSDMSFTVRGSLVDLKLTIFFQVGFFE